uniref:Premnaspirodiene oxygenase-like isoform X2 n=1 Tax=Nicotiana tabacum TaxID=4097 RepID=A0A1S3XHE0_TOBAC|nr:PREDICTED: premnaspirodiene oxygenase-like isoform X2 [Nicotiana tabacum]
MMFLNLVSIFLFASFLFLLKKWMNSKNQAKRLPPGPWKLPILGSMLHMVGGLPHRILRDLAKKYGPLMHLKLGEVSVVVVTSPEIAKEVLKTHDLAFASRPKLLAAEIVLYNSSDIAFAPYGDYWRQMRKICVLEVLNTKNIRSFSSIRRDEVFRLIQFFRSSSDKPVNFTKRISLFTSFIICRSAFGTVFKEQDEFIQVMKNVTALLEGLDVADIFPSLKFLHVLTGKRDKVMNLHHKVDSIVDNVINEHKKNLATGKFNGQLGGEDLIDVLLRLMKDGDLQFPITNDNIKAIIYDMFAAGTETTSTTIDWAMVELIRNASVFAKAQAEGPLVKSAQVFGKARDGLYFLEPSGVRNSTRPAHNSIISKLGVVIPFSNLRGGVGAGCLIQDTMTEKVGDEEEETRKEKLELWSARSKA